MIEFLAISITDVRSSLRREMKTITHDLRIRGFFLFLSLPLPLPLPLPLSLFLSLQAALGWSTLICAKRTQREGRDAGRDGGLCRYGLPRNFMRL